MSRKAFTLIELLVVIGILVILGIVVTSFVGNYFADPITRVGHIVDKEHVIRSDDDSFDSHYYYVTVEFGYEGEGGEIAQYSVSKSKYIRLLSGRWYDITTQGSWLNEFTPAQM